MPYSRSPNWRNRIGYVYAIQSENGLVKIGFGRNPFRRFASLSQGSPIPLKLVGFVRGTYAQEHKLHRLLKPWHSHREWFRIEGAVCHFLKLLPPPHPIEVSNIIHFHDQRRRVHHPRHYMRMK